MGRNESLNRIEAELSKVKNQKIIDKKSLAEGLANLGDHILRGDGTADDRYPETDPIPVFRK